jgi:hypothetical protein
MVITATAPAMIAIFAPELSPPLFFGAGRSLLEAA